MISVTDDIKKAYDESTTQVDKIVLDGQEYRITNVEYYDDCYEEGNIFGTAIARCLEFEIENSVNLEGKEVQYYTGVIIDGIIKWIELGNFIVQSVEPNDTTNINKVTAMDYMLKTNVEFQKNLNYSSGQITLLNEAREACRQAGLTLGTTDFVNNDFIVDSFQFDDGVLIRQVIQAIAQLSGSFAKIKSDNKLYFITPQVHELFVKDVHTMTVQELNNIPVEKLFLDINKVDEITKNGYKELIVKRNTHPINVVSLGMSDVEGENITMRDEPSIAIDGENVLVFNDNPYAYTQEKREELIEALFDKVKGFKYTAFEIKGQSRPYLETGDELIVIGKDGSVYSSFLFRFNYKSPNGLESELSAPSMIKATVNYQNVPDALDRLKKTELRVNKQEQTITSVIQRVENNEERIVSVELDIDGITSTVSNKVGKDEIISQINQSAEAVSINASKINLNGVVTANNYFKINADGSMEAISGKNAGFTIKSNSLYIKDSNNIESEISDEGFHIWSTSTIGGLTIKYNLIDIGIDDTTSTEHTKITNQKISVPTLEVSTITGGTITANEFQRNGSGYAVVGTNTNHHYYLNWTGSYLKAMVDVSDVGFIGLANNGYYPFNGDIPIVNSITANSDGSISWNYSNLHVSNGVITGYS